MLGVIILLHIAGNQRVWHVSKERSAASLWSGYSLFSTGVQLHSRQNIPHPDCFHRSAPSSDRHILNWDPVGLLESAWVSLNAGSMDETQVEEIWPSEPKTNNTLSALVNWNTRAQAHTVDLYRSWLRKWNTSLYFLFMTTHKSCMKCHNVPIVVFRLHSAALGCWLKNHSCRLSLKLWCCLSCKVVTW